MHSVRYRHQRLIGPAKLGLRAEAVSGIHFRIVSALRGDVVDIAGLLARPARWASLPRSICGVSDGLTPRRSATSACINTCRSYCGHCVLPRLLVLPGSRRPQRPCRPPLRCGPAGAGCACSLAFGPP
ncbi:hypothetical protein NE851_02485 (plasmid) [Rhizobium anhuiense bv. trifolii]|nr:hypothetical protein NE851_02485 [Rhizobium anhuiense bv. trifolii]